MSTNRRWILAQRPVDLPGAETFRRDDQPVPQPGAGEILVRNIYIPVDPGMRPAMLDASVGVGEFEPTPIGAVVGYMTVGQVVRSNDPAFAPGDWVTDMLLWQDFAVTSARTARKIDCSDLPPTTWLGALGIPGLSAWTGLVCLGTPRPGETVLVTSAAGTVGSLAGQIARNMGCRVVGIVGSEAKRRHLVETLRFDAAINYRAVDDLTASIRNECPRGVDILFDNVGNASVEAVLPTMRIGGRIVICGQIADYHLPPATRPGIRNTGRFVSHRLTMRGLFVYDHAARFEEAITQMKSWIRNGRLQLEQQVIDGFDNLPAAFARLFTGESSGRTIVRNVARGQLPVTSSQDRSQPWADDPTH